MLARWLFIAALALSLLTFRASAQQDTGAGAIVLVAEIDGVIGPPMAQHLADAIEAADARGAAALVLRIDTPGGLETSMRDMVSSILAAKTPVIGYVSPPGGRAASAGVFLMYATHVAAMSPGTNIGAASPVQIGAPGPASEDAGSAAPKSTMDQKAVNDAAAFVRSLAELRGRNADWGEQAVRGAAAVSAREALALGVIDFVADDLDALLTQAEGRQIALPAGTRSIPGPNAPVEQFETTFITQILNVLVNPNIAFLLMLVGVYGLIFEFANPGSIGPGVVGAVALILGLYALNQLPLNYAALALIFLGLALMGVEALSPSFGVLGFGGAVALAIGAWLLFETDVEEFRLAPAVILGAVAASAGFIFLVAGASMRSLARPVVTGREGMIGKPATVLDWRDGEGHVEVLGERWRAFGPVALSPGAVVRVVAVESLRVQVAPDHKGEAP